MERMIRYISANFAQKKITISSISPPRAGNRLLPSAFCRNDCGNAVHRWRQLLQRIIHTFKSGIGVSFKRLAPVRTASRSRILTTIRVVQKCLLREFFANNVTNFWKCPKIIVPLHRELKNRRSSSQFATIAQLAEQLTCNEQVVGSIPISSSKCAPGRPFT